MIEGKVHCQIPTDVFLVEYPQIEEFTNTQLKKLWFPNETKVEKDMHDILTNFTEQERHGLYTVLKLFSKYECIAGEEYWGNRFQKIFGRFEFTSMAATFSAFELAIHRPFYNKINELLNSLDANFYTQYKENPILSARIKQIDEIVNHENDLISIAAFTFIEGAILYASFAFLKHFQVNGMNKLVNTVRGINLSTIDEGIHFYAGAYCFKLLCEQKQVSPQELKEIQDILYDMAEKLIEHEDEITNMVHEKGIIDTCSPEDMKLFSRNRINECFLMLGLEPLFKVEESPINKWFYKNLNTFHYNDFFIGKGREYLRDWDEHSFVW